MTQFLQDRETENATLFGFEGYSDALAAMATDPALKTPFTIAVYGDWGSGKTSLMKTVSRKIDSKIEAKSKTIWFNAWKYERSDQPLWSAFLNLILSEISDLSSDEGVRARVKEVAGIISIIAAEFLTRRFAGEGLSDLRQVAASFQNRVTEIKTLRDKLNDTIKDALSKDPRHHTRIIVFVDDLDRCLNDKIVELFESIKLFLDCENCVFILGFDREQLKHAFDQKYGGKDSVGSRYIEKFVQLEFELPRKAPAQVAAFVKTVAPSELKDNTVVLDIISNFVDPNPRKIVRWMNRVALVQELFKSAHAGTQENVIEEPPAIVPVWVFVKSFFPEFASLVERDPDLFYLVAKRARGEASSSEAEKIKSVTVDAPLENFFRSLSPTVLSDSRLGDAIFQTKLTITESVSRLQPHSILREIDRIPPDEVDVLVDELSKSSKGKLIESSKLIGEELIEVKEYAEYKTASNRIRFLRRAVLKASTESEKRAFLQILVNILKSIKSQTYWDFGTALYGLLKDPIFRKEALADNLVELFVAQFMQAYSWEIAGEFSEILVLFIDDLTDSQANQVANAVLTNSQVRDSFRAMPRISAILNENKAKIKPDVWNQVKEHNPGLGLDR